jgi:hypothetical protein
MASMGLIVLVDWFGAHLAARFSSSRERAGTDQLTFFEIASEGLNMTIITSPLLRLTLRLHGLYFVLYAVAWQLFVPQIGALVGLPPPTTVIGHVAIDVSAGSMATIGVLLLGASRYQHLPRFVILTALVQAALNLLHGANWILRGYALALVVPDAIFIALVFAVYLRASFGARATAGSHMLQPEPAAATPGV